MIPNLERPRDLPTVYLVDDETVVRDALAWLLRTRRLLSEGFESGEAFESWVHAEVRTRGRECWPGAPSCLVLDVRMPGVSGLALFDRLAEQGLNAALPVIFLTGHGDVPTAVSAVKRGAFDFVEKPFSNNALVDRIEQALDASAQALVRRRERRLFERRLSDLTDRERDVMGLVVEGRSNKRIAEALDISVRTVEIHRARVFEKIGVKSAVELSMRLRHAAEGADR